MSLTVGRLARKFGLSRSTLLYYDSIGLLSPTGHAKGEYRIYSSNDEKRLATICTYRKAGIPLKEIAKILNGPRTSVAAILQRRFEDLNRQIAAMWQQQRIIADLLKNREILTSSEIMTKERWVGILLSSGYTEADMRRWHIRFEEQDPDGHLQFLKYLRLDEAEIESIRKFNN